MPQFLHTPAPNATAQKFLRGKTAVSAAVYHRLLPEIRARAITITGVESTTIIARARARIAKLPAGAQWDEVKQGIVEDLVSWLEPQRARRRAELLLRTHGYQAYGAAAYEVMDRQRDVFPYWQYQSADDSRVRPTHAALDGKVLPADSPFWQAHYPPWEFGCRCQVVPLSEDDVQGLRQADAKRPPEARRVVEGSALSRLESSGTLMAEVDGVPRNYDVRSPREKQGGSGFYWHPGDLTLSVDQLGERYRNDPQTWDWFTRWAQAHRISPHSKRTVWEWLSKESVAAAVARKPKVAAASLGIGVATMRQRIREAGYTSKQDLGGGVNTTAILTNGEKVVFKPASGEHGVANDSWLRPGIAPGTQYRREKAASIIDEVLGVNLVPATEIIEYAGERGSAQLFQQGFRMPFELAREGVLRSKTYAFLTKRQRQDWHLLDWVLGHSDRHGGNWMLRKHAKGWDLALIDNGLSMSDQKVYASDLIAKPAALLKLDRVSQRRLTRLLDSESEWRPRLAELVSEDAIDLMLGRVRLLQEHGRFPKY